MQQLPGTEDHLGIYLNGLAQAIRVWGWEGRGQINAGQSPFYKKKGFRAVTTEATITATIMSKSDFSQNLLANSKTSRTASEKIPIIARWAVSDRAKKTLDLV